MEAVIQKGKRKLNDCHCPPEWFFMLGWIYFGVCVVDRCRGSSAWEFRDGMCKLVGRMGHVESGPSRQSKENEPLPFVDHIRFVLFLCLMAYGDVPQCVLYEHAIGYVLFRVTEFEDIGSSVSQVEESIADMQRFRSVVKVEAFEPFKNTESALENCNSVSEGN
ncbi:Nucleolar kke/d repeat protein [Dirofilaria immitis]|nr:Nucleolar kke/d repeat protein [Dirofilaria immitis]